MQKEITIQELEHYSDLIADGILKDSKPQTERAWELINMGLLDTAGNIL